MAFVPRYSSSLIPKLKERDVITLLGEIFYFFLGAALAAWWFSVTILPIFYGLPKAFYWCARRLFSWRLCFSYLAPPVIWNAAFVGLAVALYIWFPSVHSRLSESTGYTVGQWLGFGGSLLSALTQDGRKNLRHDFQDNAMKRVVSPALLEEYRSRNRMLESGEMEAE